MIRSTLSPTTHPAIPGPVYDDRADIAEELTTERMRRVQVDAALERSRRLARICGVTDEQWTRWVWGQP